MKSKCSVPVTSPVLGSELEGNKNDPAALFLFVSFEHTFLPFTTEKSPHLHPATLAVSAFIFGLCKPGCCRKTCGTIVKPLMTFPFPVIFRSDLTQIHELTIIQIYSNFFSSFPHSSFIVVTSVLLVLFPTGKSNIATPGVVRSHGSFYKQALQGKTAGLFFLISKRSKDVNLSIWSSIEICYVCSMQYAVLYYSLWFVLVLSLEMEL